MTIRIQQEPFDYGGESAAFAQAADGAGAVVTFLGLVRDEDARISRMEVEHYPGMTERALAAIAVDAHRRWALADILIIHRYGTLQPGDAIMMVGTASRHRSAAFKAAEFLMDYLKSRAPFWKKEFGSDGAEWVAATDQDEAALKNW